MDNFSYYNPVKILFGKGMIAQLKKEIPLKSRVLVIYGGGSIRRNGVYDQVRDALTGYEWTEFAGIEANPHYETCMRAVEEINRSKISFLLAVGGGSVLDATKFIAAAACFKGDAWDILAKRAPVRKALPLACVMTLPATGSEMNSGAVITKASTQEKLAFNSPLVFPQFSVLDPETTYSLPDNQTANGIIDAFVHVCEQYLTYPVNAPIQDRYAEAILLTLVENGTKVLNAPHDYDLRANIMWTATMALNGLIAVGVPQDWATHMIGHEITAFHGLAHAETLAIVLPALARVMKENKKEKLLQMGERVFNINSGSTEEKIEQTIHAMETFFQSLGVRTKLSEYGLGEDIIEPIAKRFEERGWMLGEKQDITPDRVREILQIAL
ncbi:iron-containing alcohol dehydrogenase [Bacteroides sp. 224]|uniref:iron-containing alcohol dehydrogenase n=1 Tax=Bacteroides sp. 224 TaxID=2302936 RepID=UPI0013D3657E|nr:iron-containing alcohol dehydrogenase [Bacteroides sp. 224]NDV66610.1 iron-containing alcohol dehydrogenase [Bacteroides sp. 224]